MPRQLTICIVLCYILLLLQRLTHARVVCCASVAFSHALLRISSTHAIHALRARVRLRFLKYLHTRELNALMWWYYSSWSAPIFVSWARLFLRAHAVYVGSRRRCRRASLTKRGRWFAQSRAASVAAAAAAAILNFYNNVWQQPINANCIQLMLLHNAHKINLQI